jgi:hypothetical protein
LKYLVSFACIVLEGRHIGWNGGMIGAGNIEGSELKLNAQHIELVLGVEGESCKASKGRVIFRSVS